MLSNAGTFSINKILYVDDEPGMLEVGKLFLEDNRTFRVDTSPSALEALDHLSSLQYDAIVSDFEMPKMNGLAFLKTLRARGDTTPFIIFTGRGREDVVIEALNSGADFYLQKGGDPTAQFAELEHKILHAISRRQADLALKKSEQDYRHLIEHAGEAIFVIQDEVFQLVNPQARVLSGYSEQELLGQPFVRFAHQEDSAPLLDAFRKRNAGVSVPSHHTFRIVRKDGTIRWVELNVVAVTWNERPAILNFMTDITDRKLAEDALKESEGRYRHLIEHAGEAIFVTQDEVFRLVNPQLTGVSGYSQPELLSQPFTRFVHPDDATTLRDNYRKRMAGASDLPSHYIFRIIRKDGTIRWVELSVVLIDWNGAPAILNFMIDITERKFAEDGLKESEERYRHLIEHASEGIYVVQNERLQMVNPQTTEMCGYTEQELISQPFKNFVHPDDFAILFERFQRRINGESVPSRYSFRISRKDGTLRWVELSVGTIDWNGAPATLNYVTDITERKRAEDALKESEERYRQFFRTSLDGLFITTPDGQWIDFNDAIVEMFGCRSREEVFCTTIRSFYASPEDRAAIVQRAEQEGYVKEYPLSYRRRDGTIFAALMTVVAQKNPDGSTRMFIGTLRDITERKRTEDALRESEERYRQFFRTTLDGLFITTMDGRWIDFNDAIVDLLGYASREEVFCTTIISLYVHPNERAAFIGCVEREGYVKEYPVQMTKRDGTVIDTLMTVALQRNPDGSTKTLIGTIRDVTERKRTEEALRESEEQYRLFFKTSQDSVFISGSNRRYIDCNDNLVERLGCKSREEALAVDVASTYAHPEERARFLELVNREGYVREYPLTFRKRDGTSFDTLISIVARKNPDGSTKAYFGTVRDITDRKRTEAALKESEERYRHIFESFEDLYYQTDMSGIITILSPSLYGLTGYTEDELIGQPVSKIYVNPEDRRFLLDELAKNGHVRDYEVLLRRKDGTEPLTSLSANRIYHADGTPAGVAGILRDITRRKRAEDALRESETKFRSLVDYALEAILILDLQGTILFANNAAARRIEADHCADLIGRNVMEFVAPESRGDVVKDFEEVARGHDAYVARYHLISLKGRDVFVESIGKVITYEGKPVDLISLRDVTGQKQ